MDRYCRNCKSELQGDENFCPICGSEIHKYVAPNQDTRNMNHHLSKKQSTKTVAIWATSCILLCVLLITGTFFALYAKKNNKNVEETKNQTIEVSPKEEKVTSSSSESENENIVPESSTDQVYNLAREYYGDFLEYYKEQESAGFSGAPSELINEMFFSQGFFPDGFKNYDITLYYTVIDLAGDGVPELFISDKEILYDAYGLMESEGQIWPLFGDSTMGNRTHYTICENNMIRCESSSGAAYNTVAYYRVEPHAYTSVCSEAIVQEEQTYYFATENSHVFSYMDAATQADYEALTVKYPEKEDIQWLKLSEF